MVGSVEKKTLGLIGRKIGMDSFFDQNGNILPCTILESKECIVTQIKKKEKEGYDAVQLGYGNRKEKNIKKSVVGHLKKVGCGGVETMKEFRDFGIDVKVGDKIGIGNIFSEGDKVDIIGISKGKGFQGVVKRHGFSGVGSQTHGQHNRMRHPGSIGASSFPSRVFPGLRMAGRTGGDRVTVKNLPILSIKLEKNIIVVKGCVPGGKNNLVIIKKK